MIINIWTRVQTRRYKLIYYFLAATVVLGKEFIQAAIVFIAGEKAQAKWKALQKTDGHQIVAGVTEMGIRTQVPMDVMFLHDVMEGYKNGMKESLEDPKNKAFSLTEQKNQAEKNGLIGAIKNIRIPYFSVPLITGFYNAYQKTKGAYTQSGFWKAVDVGTDELARLIPGGNIIMNSLDEQEKAVLRRR